MSFTDKINAVEELAFRNAGATPAARTFGMVTEANESNDIELVKGELNHTRAHYQSLEYMLTNEEQIILAIEAGIEAGHLPAPETPADMLRLTARFYNTVILEEAYGAAHNVGFYQAIGAADNVDTALQLIYSHLDFVDHAKEQAIDAELRDLLDQDSDD